MKYITLCILLIVALLATLRANAQPLPPAGPYNLMCLPKEVGGTGSATTVRSNSAGVTRWHFCNDGFVWRSVFEAYPWSAVSNPSSWTLFESVRASLPAAQGAASANLIGSVNTEPLLSVWKEWQPQILASRPPSPWVVARSGANTARPAYQLRPDGTRDPVSVGTTPIVANGVVISCDMRVRFLEWPLYYGKVPDSNPVRVTVCQKR